MSLDDIYHFKSLYGINTMKPEVYDESNRSVKGSGRTIYRTKHGRIINGDSEKILNRQDTESANLVITSPPFGLVTQKEYGNVSADRYLEWFRPFARQFHRILKENGSLVIDIGGTWNKGRPTRNLYHFKLLIMLCEEFGFHLAQEFYWWNPSKLPTPAEWVTVRRIRVKDAVNTVWWLSKSPWPKASNRRVLQPYSESMEYLLANGYRSKRRPSGHDISDRFNVNNGAAIPPNIIAAPNTESSSGYQRYCEKRELPPHPARFPIALPEYFVRMLTDEGDLVIDPFAGSCATGEVCEKLHRRWVGIELRRDYCESSKGRFLKSFTNGVYAKKSKAAYDYYQIPRADLLWCEKEEVRLKEDGGKKRPKMRSKK